MTNSKRMLLKPNSILPIILCYTIAIITAYPFGQFPENRAHPALTRQYILSRDFKITSTSITRKYTFNVAESTAALDGFLRPVLAINGQIPGPLIEANEGDHLEITVVNQMKLGLTIHWHGLYQNGSNWEDGVTGVSQCPIPPDGGKYTYKFNLTGQFGTFWYHSHQQNLMADGISGPLIIHSPRDPLKRHRDFDQEVVLMLYDWYHNTSGVIVSNMLSEAGYFGTPAAPAPNSALINGVGQWNCSYATRAQECQQIKSPPEFIFKAGESVRFRLINGASHAMFFYSVDEHSLNVTEADSTPIHGPPTLDRIQLHNGQRYSVVIKTKADDAGKSFFMRAIMDSDCWAWVPEDIQLTAFGIVRLVSDYGYDPKKISHSLPRSRDWPDPTEEDCLDLADELLVPIIKETVPSSVLGSGSFESAFGFQFIDNPSEHLSRNQAIQIAQQANASQGQAAPRQSNVTNLKAGPDTSDDSNSVPVIKRDTTSGKWTTLISKRQVQVGKVTNLPAGPSINPPGITRLGGPPPTPRGTIGKFFVSNVTWTTYPYQPVLHDLIPGGVGVVNNSRVANVVYPRPEWYDLYLVNIDAAASHPWHLHGMDMHVVARGQGLPTQENLANLTYNTANPLRRDTIVVPPAAFAVVRVLADLPGVWIVHCHIGWHLGGGFAGVVIVQPDVINRFQIPQDNLGLCLDREGPLDTIEPGA